MRIAQWMREHGSAVRGYILSLVRHQDIADDLVQDVFRRAVEADEKYDERGHARAYLMRIADHLVIDHIRRSGREVNVDDWGWTQLATTPASSDPSKKIADKEQFDELNRALETLTTDQRRVLLLRYYSDMKFTEISETIGSPLNTVLSHCRRGLQALRQILVDTQS